MSEADHRPTSPDTSASASTDAAEFEAFYRGNAVALVRFLVLQGASLADAAEIAQDTLAEVFVRWQRIDHPRAWCHRVASRAWIRRAVHKQPEDLTADPPPSPLLRPIPVDAWHQRHDLITALAALPPRQRQIMAWRLSGYEPREIAAELGITGEQVRSNLLLARRRLSQRLASGKETRS